PRYALSTAGSLITRSGAPSAILRPASSTTTRSEKRITARMMCSIMITATPRSLSRKRMARMSSTSAVDSPAMASSATSRAGAAASARASSSLRRSTWVRSAELSCARPAKPTSSRIATASASASPAPSRSGRAYCSGISRFSSTDMLRNGRGIWKLRVMPRRTRRYAGRRVTSRPLKITAPPSQGSAPEMQLIIVVLPEPFGPIRPRRSPSNRCMLTPSSARKPPKRLDRFSTRSMGSATPSPLAPLVLDQPDDALRRRHDEEHQQHADDQDVDLGRDGHGRDFLDRAEQQGADHRTVPGRGAADHGHGDGVDRDGQIERRERVDEGDEKRIGHARDRHQRAHGRGRDQLQAQGRHAGALRRHFVVADRGEPLADARELEVTCDGDRNQGEREDQDEQELDVVVEEG